MRARELNLSDLPHAPGVEDAPNSDPNHIVIGTASSGVWISKYGGPNWTPLFDCFRAPITEREQETK
jgi:hypothetical protein